jgi:uncharacterized protein (TIGR02118 family)
MCIKRNKKLSREEFKNYWSNNHAKLFTKLGSMGSKKYIQSHTIDTPLNKGLNDSRGMLEEYDGVAEVWFESIDSLMELMGSEKGIEIGSILHEDEKNFIDHSKSTAFIVEEIEVK